MSAAGPLGVEHRPAQSRPCRLKIGIWQVEQRSACGRSRLRRVRGGPGGGGSFGAPLPLLLRSLPVGRLPRQDRVLRDPAMGTTAQAGCKAVEFADTLRTESQPQAEVQSSPRLAWSTELHRMSGVPSRQSIESKQ